MLRTPILLATAAFLLYGQAADKRLTFDAASVKPATPLTVGGGTERKMVKKAGRGNLRPSGGPGTDDPRRIHYPYSTLKDLLTTAYGVKDYQIAGPDWPGIKRFAVDATRTCLPSGSN